MKNSIIGTVIFIIQFLNVPSVAKQPKLGKMILEMESEEEVKEFSLRPVQVRIRKAEVGFDIAIR